jgi:hypothetical protein
VKFEPMKSEQSHRAGGSYDLLMRATVLLTVRSTGQSGDPNASTGTQSITLSSSVMPRRNVW